MIPRRGTACCALLLLQVLQVSAESNPNDQGSQTQETQRQTVLRAMRERPADPWPRGVGHVILAPPGSREEWKSYHEPGGSFSPTVGSFGVSIWAFGDDGKLATTSDSIPQEQVDQRFYWRVPQHVPAIHTKTPFYESRWSLVGPVSVKRTWRLDLNRGMKRAKLVLEIRSVGPAGSRCD